MAGKPADLALIAADQASTMIPKRPHKKSRLGCTNCKQRKVKCDESHPVCRSCTLRGAKCEYDSATLIKARLSEMPITPTSRGLPRLPVKRNRRTFEVPRPVSPRVDGVDMQLLWFYTSATYKSLSYSDESQSFMNDMLQTVMVQHAFEAPFLMDSILELAILHRQSLGLASEPTRALAYRVRSFEGYRKAIADACPEVFGALLANSVLRPVLSTHFFRDPNWKDLYLLDWMSLWQGVRSIVSITSEKSILSSGMQPLFIRPPLDSEVSILAIPKQLLLMVSFIDSNEEDASDMQTYQESLRALGALFEGLRRGMNSTMVLRVITWSTIIPQRLLVLARAGRPRALVILAHYATFLKLLQDIWWLASVGDRSIRDICRVLGPTWHTFMGIPRSVLLTEDSADLSSLILDSADE